jgi:hypothetical protein
LFWCNQTSNKTIRKAHRWGSWSCCRSRHEQVHQTIEALPTWCTAVVWRTRTGCRPRGGWTKPPLLPRGLWPSTLGLAASPCRGGQARMSQRAGPTRMPSRDVWMARRCGAQLHAVMGGSQGGAAVRYCTPSREPAGAAAVRHCTRTRSGLRNGEPWRGGMALCGCGTVTGDVCVQWRGGLLEWAV